MTRRIGPYLLHEAIGQGGTSTVFRATCERSTEVVAVKVISDTEAERARPAAYALLDFDHPHAARVRDVVDDGDLAVVMDLVEGPTLDEWLRRGHRLRPAQVEEFTDAIAGALQAAARLRISHGDVAPRNVILSPSGPVLVDFGMHPGEPDDDIAALTRLAELVSRPTSVLPPSTTTEMPDRPRPAPPIALVPNVVGARPGGGRAIRAVAAVAAAAILGSAALTFLRPSRARAGTTTDETPGCATVRVDPSHHAGEKQ